MTRWKDLDNTIRLDTITDSDRRTVGQTVYNYTARELQKLVKKSCEPIFVQFWGKIPFHAWKRLIELYSIDLVSASKAGFYHDPDPDFSLIQIEIVFHWTTVCLTEYFWALLAVRVWQLDIYSWYTLVYNFYSAWSHKTRVNAVSLFSVIF